MELRKSYHRNGHFTGDGRITGRNISRLIGISKDGAFLGRSAFQRMGRFKGWGVSWSIGILQDGALGKLGNDIRDLAPSRSYHFSIDWH